MSQTLNASMLLAVPLAPLLGALVAGLLGTQFGGNLIGRRMSHSLTIGGVLLSFILSAITLDSVVNHGARFNQTIYTWMVVGGLKMEIGFLVDGLTAMMMCVVSFVSLMVHIYTIGYMQEDRGYNRFFCLHLFVHVFHADAGHEQQPVAAVFWLGGGGAGVLSAVRLLVQ